MANYLQIAGQFGAAIVRGDYATAHSLLTPEAQLLYSPATIEYEVQEMIAYVDGPILEYEVNQQGILLDWPAKREHEIAHVYVGLNGEGFSEAASLLLRMTDVGIRIDEIEWGRP